MTFIIVIRKYTYILSTLLSIILSMSAVYCQTTISGIVRNNTTDAPVPNVRILISNSNHSTTTDSNGYYIISFDDTASIISFMHPDYDTEVASFTHGYEQRIDMRLSGDVMVNNLEDVVITNKKVKYSNKNNPAVELIKKVVAAKDDNRMVSAPFVSYKTYDKLHLSASNIPKFVQNNFILRPLKFIFDNVDSISEPGLKLVPMFIQERWADNYHRLAPAAHKKVITAEKVISLDPKLINEEATIAKVRFLFDDFDIYDNNLRIMTNNFVSPIASTGPTFYKYYIEDTTVVDGDTLIELSFEPRNTSDILLRGHLMIDYKNNHAVQSAYMTISKFTNINFVKNLHINVSYEKNSDNKYSLSTIENKAFFTLIRGGQLGKVGILGIRSTKYMDMTTHDFLPADTFKSPEVVVPDNLPKHNSDYYEPMRPMALSPYEHRTYHLEDSMKQLTYYKRLLKWSSILISGYVTTGKLDIGPYMNLMGYNPVEGFRLKVGLRTNPIANKRIYARSYLAYGFKDEVWKHLAEVRYSLKNKRIYDYPMHYITLSSQYDSKVPGRIYETNVNDNLVGSIQRGSNDRFIYTHILRGSYIIELPKNVLITADAAYLNQTPQGSLYFVQALNGQTDTIRHFTSNAFGLQVRWAPGEKYYFDRVQRSRLPTSKPVITLRAEYGIKDVFQSTYDYQKYSMTVEKRFNLSMLGLLDVEAKGNIIYGDLPYPLLNIPRANQSYTYSNGSYNLMNYGEFVSDRQLELNINYRMYGFILNKIPLIKKLQWREIFGFKMIYGALSDRNNPAINPAAIRFPMDETGNSFIHTFQRAPYMEWSVGVSNILKVIRVDYIQRINYLHHSNAPRHGVRIGFMFDL